MSDDLPITRVRWSSRGGFARHNGVQMELSYCPPVMACCAIAEIDFVPGLQVLKVREHAAAWRDLEPDEAAEMMAWLERWTNAARTAAERI